MLPAGMLSGRASKDLPGYKDFKLLDLHKADFEQIRFSLATVDWKSLWDKSSLDEFSTVINKVVLDTCKQFCRHRKTPRNHHLTSIPNLHAPQRKKRKLHGRLKAIKQLNPMSRHIPQMESKLKEFNTNIA